MAKQWQIKHNGKAQGPFSDSQLRKLATSGRINRKTPVRANENAIWMVAERVPGLFSDEPASGETQQTGSVQFVPTSEDILNYADVQDLPKAAPEAIWQVGHDGKTFGPFSVEQLTERVRSGWLRPTDLVWKPGLPNWEPATTISGLFPNNVPPPLPVEAGVDRGVPKKSAGVDGGKRAPTRKKLRYAMLVTVLAWPVLSVLMANFVYNYEISGHPWKETGYGNLQNQLSGAIADKSTVFIPLLVSASMMLFIFISFCLVVEGLLLFAMKDDKE